MKFTQRNTIHINTPGLLSPYYLSPGYREVGFELEFVYTDSSFDATLTVDVSDLTGDCQRFIFKVDSDSAGVLHFAKTVLFRRTDVAPNYTYVNLGDMFQDNNLKVIMRGLSARIVDNLVDDLFEEPLHVQKPTLGVEYTREFLDSKEIHRAIQSTIDHLADCMPDYRSVFMR